MADRLRFARPTRSAERWCDQQPAVLPELVLPAREAEPRAFAQVALEDLAVVSDLFDRLIGPVGREAVLLPEIIAHAEQALDLRYLALLHLVDIRLRDAEFFGGDQREEGPAHDVRPLTVVLAHNRADRLLRDDLGQDDMRIAVLQLQATRREGRAIVGPGVAATLIVRVARLVEVL